MERASAARVGIVRRRRAGRPRPPRTETLRDCKVLRRYNSALVESSATVHQNTLRGMAWGLAAVGGVGALAGLLLGYGVARGLSRSIRQLLVRVQAAADQLGHDMPTVELRGGDGLDKIDEQLEQVVGRIGDVVGQLQQR